MPRYYILILRNSTQKPFIKSRGILQCIFESNLTIHNIEVPVYITIMERKRILVESLNININRRGLEFRPLLCEGAEKRSKDSLFANNFEFTVHMWVSYLRNLLCPQWEKRGAAVDGNDLWIWNPLVTWGVDIDLLIRE